MPAIQFSLIETFNPFFLILGYGFSIITAFKYQVNFFKKSFLIVLLVIVIWSIAQFLFHRTFFRLSPFIILEIISAYVIANVFKDTILRRFENITYILCVIALVGWVLMIVLNPMMKSLAETIGIEASGDGSSSFIIYTVNLVGYRNCGFGWEPGRTACMICVGILLYLIRTKGNFRTYRFWIMTVCLVSTMSTTGFFVYTVEVILCYKIFHKINAAHIIFLSLMVVGMMSLPFMGEKLGSLLGNASVESVTDMGKNLTWNSNNKSEGERRQYVPQRFEGLMFSGMNLINTNYLIGDGRDYQRFYINRVLDWRVKTSEGLLEIFVRYGIVIGLLSYYLLYRASARISTFFKIRNKWLYFITFLLINVSYNFWEVPVFMAIWMMPLFVTSTSDTSEGVK